MTGKDQGFTLVEVLAVVSLVILIFAGGISALVSAYSFFGLENKKTRASDDLAIIYNYLKKDAFQAEAVSFTGSNISFTIGATTVNYGLIGTNYSRGTTLLSDIISSVSYGTTLSPNYLNVDITATQADPDITLKQNMGFMLRCKATN
jgi:type II secretory pathway pseudopilin PulG